MTDVLDPGVVDVALLALAALSIVLAGVAGIAFLRQRPQAGGGARRPSR